MLPSQLTELPKKLSTGVHTVRQMQHRQLLGIGKRTLREQTLPRLPLSFEKHYDRQIPADCSVYTGPISENTALLRGALDASSREQSRTRARAAAEGSVTFMNRTLVVADGTEVDWFDDRYDEFPLLWPLKLYAFQPIAWLCEGVETATPRLQSVFDGWIEDWTDSVTVGKPGYLRRAWTPWAVSLRILNWSRYLGWRESTEFDRTLGRALYKNALFLANHVEWDVGGNHLIENGAALFVAGLVFDEDEWKRAGERILAHAAENQFLDDGCHFERSPMYHILTLTRYLTVCDLADRFDRTIPTSLPKTAERATAFLAALRPPDGRIPLLNDAVYGQALGLDECLRYAEAVGFDTEPVEQPGPDSETAGYRWLRTEIGDLLVDGGPVGPPHLPGHSHSDTLSILLYLGDQPVVTDTGTFGYTSDCRRSYARGVQGHNTVQVGDSEPIALGGKYLMGPRSAPTTRFEQGAVSLFEGRYEARPYRDTPYVHHRSVAAGDRWWAIRDTLDTDKRAKGRLHLHPDVDPVLESNGRIRLDYHDKHGQAFVHPLASTRLGITTGQYFPEFGVAIDRAVITIDVDSEPDTISMGTAVTDDSVGSVTLEQRTDGSGTLHLDDKRKQLPEEMLCPR